MERRQGHVRWFSPEKGYGFLLDEQTQDEVFVHFSAIQSPGFKRLQEGQKVVFARQQGPKGWQAVEVVPVLDDDKP
ncbi:MAG: cold shock domain-containing protein [Myxococcota bacterium]|nr:cold shock domain-containing protein [Myxococcota bacterium]